MAGAGRPRLEPRCKISRSSQRPTSPQASEQAQAAAPELLVEVAREVPHKLAGCSPLALGLLVRTLARSEYVVNGQPELWHALAQAAAVRAAEFPPEDAAAYFRFACDGVEPI